MAARGAILFHDDAATAPGQVRGWKVAFGYTTKGTIVSVYRVRAGGIDSFVTEIPLLANGRADTTAVSNWLAGYGVSVPNAAKTLIGA